MTSNLNSHFLFPTDGATVKLIIGIVKHQPAINYNKEDGETGKTENYTHTCISKSVG